MKPRAECQLVLWVLHRHPGFDRCTTVGGRYLWFTISTVPYCSIQSFPIITLWTQQVGLVHV